MNCSCGGANPNCYRCDGRGYIGDHRGSSLNRDNSVSSKVSKKSSSPPITEKLIPLHKNPTQPAPPFQPARCRYCEEPVFSSDRAEQHMDEHHTAPSRGVELEKPWYREAGRIWDRSAMEASERRIGGREMSRTIVCPGKALHPPSIPLAEKPITLKKRGPEIVRTPDGCSAIPKAKNTSASGIQLAQGKCGVCGISMPTSSLAKHLKRKHSQIPSSQNPALSRLGQSKKKASRGFFGRPKEELKRLAEAPQRTVPPLLDGMAPIDEPSTSNLLEEYRENRRLDGSRDYWQIREEGGFGSHSSFDDMGDEADP